VTLFPDPPGGSPSRPKPWRPARRKPARPRNRSRRAGDPSQAPPALPDWDTLAGADRQAAWASLARWVTWLHDRYELSVEERLPHCWAEHPGLVEELTALRAWRQEIWGAARPSGQAARYWHAELRQTITAATTFYAAGCRAGHRSAEPASPELAHRWAQATPPGNPTAPGGPAGGYLPGAAMAAHLAAGRAAALSETITGYLRHDQSWWEPVSGGWQRITDQATASLLDHHAQAMARADQAVRRAAALQQGMRQ
jgi:hypothetical protein